MRRRAGRGRTQGALVLLLAATVGSGCVPKSKGPEMQTLCGSVSDSRGRRSSAVFYRCPIPPDAPTEVVRYPQEPRVWPAPGGVDFDWRAGIRWVRVPSVGLVGPDWGSPTYRDVVSHAYPVQRWPFPDDGPEVIVHETTHAIDTDRRIRFWGVDRHWFFYARAGGGFYVPDARGRCPSIVADIPPSIAERTTSMIRTYVENPYHRDSGLLYLFEEWNAASLEEGARIETCRLRRSCPSSAAWAPTAWLALGSVAVVTMSRYEAGYLNHNGAFKSLYARLAEETMGQLRLAQSDALLSASAATAIHQALATSPDAEPVRQALRTWLGPRWTGRVVGF